MYHRGAKEHKLLMNEAQFKQLSKKEQLNSTLEGTAFWAFVSKPKVSEKYKTTNYTLNLGLDAENQRRAEQLGLKIKPADKGVPMPYVEIKRKVKDGIAPETVKPELVDSAQKPLKEGTLIGNHSKVRVKFGRYWYETSGGGVGTVLFKVQVLELVAFDGSKDRDLVSDGSGYVGSIPAEFSIEEFLAEDPTQAVG